MLISMVKVRSPTSIKAHQDSRFLIHTYPCAEYHCPSTTLQRFHTSTLQRLASLKLFAKICPVGQPKLNTVQVQGTEPNSQSSEVNNADLRHSKNVENTQKVSKSLQQQCQGRKCAYEIKTGSRSKEQMNSLLYSSGKALLFLHLIQCHACL